MQTQDYPSQLIAYEEGELSEDKTLSLFQHLIDTGLCWLMPRQWGRTAIALIRAGHCHDPHHSTKETDDDADRPFDDTDCPQCDGPGTMIGKMHRQLFLRCELCGHDYRCEV